MNGGSDGPGLDCKQQQYQYQQQQQQQQQIHHGDTENMEGHGETNKVVSSCCCFSMIFSMLSMSPWLRK
jgi:hypothetical protein